jgi:phosphatidylglycerophosphate synthase
MGIMKDRMKEFVPALRVNQALTAALERRLLVWMAERAPRWLTSDQLTALGLAAEIAAATSFALARYDRYALLAVAPCLALNWLGDSLDGTLARVRSQQRPRYGFYVDHMVDTVGAVALMGGLAVSGLLHPEIAAAMLIGFLVLSSESFLATYTLSRFELSEGIFGPTEIRILLAAGALAALHSPHATVFRQRLFLFDIGGAIAAGCMVAMAAMRTVRHTVQLFRAEPLPVKGDSDYGGLRMVPCEQIVGDGRDDQA